MNKKKTLTQRVENLEYLVYRKWIKECPRCKNKSMNEYQERICRICAYKEGEPL